MEPVGVFETGLSYISAPGPPLCPLTVGQVLDEAAKKSPTSEFLYDAPINLRLTFSQLKNEVDWLASGLLKLGLNPGDRIGIWGPNSGRWIITFLAAAKVGIIIVPLSTGYEAPELLYALNHVSIKCIVLAEEVKTRNFYKILKDAIPDIKISVENDDTRNQSPVISSTVAPHLQKIIYMGNERLHATQLWLDVQTRGEEEKDDLDKMNRISETVQCDDILYILFTSGTTGRAKGAMLSHHSQINGSLRFGRRCGFTPEDRHILLPPPFHLYGIGLGIMFPICFGSSVVIPSPTFSPTVALTTAAKEKCTWLHGPPTMFSDMIGVPEFDQLDLSAVRAATLGGTSTAKTLLIEIKKKFKISGIFTGYGMTETACLTRISPQDPPELLLTTVGLPLENTELKIVDAQGWIVPVGWTGEICARAYSVMQGYWEDPEKTSEAIDPAGWCHTGDAGYFLDSGHLVVVGRFKDMIIRGGENIYPQEIEDFLYQNMTDEIDEVHVFGVADERLGEVVAAWILLKSESESESQAGVTIDTNVVKGVCEGKISSSKIPVYIKFVQRKEEFPKTASGKVQKNVLRQQYEKELGLSLNKSTNDNQ